MGAAAQICLLAWSRTAALLWRIALGVQCGISPLLAARTIANGFVMGVNLEVEASHDSCLARSRALRLDPRILFPGLSN